jgi:hypothetical protein
MENALIRKHLACNEGNDCKTYLICSLILVKELFPNQDFEEQAVQLNQALLDQMQWSESKTFNDEHTHPSKNWLYA